MPSMGAATTAKLKHAAREALDSVAKGAAKSAVGDTASADATGSTARRRRKRPILVQMETANLIPERDLGSMPILQAERLGIDFGGLTAVDNFSIALGRTEISGIIGPNGAGKTTTVEMLAGLRRPTQGSVRVLGLNPFSDLMRFLILGILLDGPLSLYDMRKQFAAGISLFYTASSGSIQRALGQLASHGWVTILDADDSRRRKKVYVVNDASQQAWREWMHAPVTASDAEPTMLAKVCLLGRLPAADRRACVRRGAAREDRGGCRSARLVGSGTRCYRGLGRRPAGLPLTAGDPGPRHPRACARNVEARREKTA